jgi:ankyrin repeat protein
MLAARANHTSVVLELLEHGARVDNASEGWTALDYAAAEGHCEIAKLPGTDVADDVTVNRDDRRRIRERDLTQTSRGDVDLPLPLLATPKENRPTEIRGLDCVMIDEQQLPDSQ